MTRSAFIKTINQYFNLNENEYIDKIDKYLIFLREENAKYNLTRLDGEEIVYEKYFFNSLIPFIGMDLNNKKVLDIGSGSGTPGIVLKIIFPKMELSILEASRKKANFMQQLLDKLDIADVHIYNTRAETVDASLVETFDIVTSRAVASIPILIEISCQYIKIGGMLIEPKTINYTDEWKMSQGILKSVNMVHTETRDFVFGDMTHKILMLTKTAASPNMYPRAWRDIIKEFKDE